MIAAGEMVPDRSTKRLSGTAWTRRRPCSLVALRRVCLLQTSQVSRVSSIPPRLELRTPNGFGPRSNGFWGWAAVDQPKVRIGWE